MFPGRPVLSASRPARPGPAAPPCAPSRRARGMFGFWNHQTFTGHALHENGLQRQKCVGPLVSSQEQRALLVPRLNRSSTAGQPRILFPHSVYIGFRLFVLLERRSCNICSMLWRVRGTLVSWATCSVGVPSGPARPRRPAVRSVPTRPWYVRVLDSTS